MLWARTGLPYSVSAPYGVVATSPLAPLLLPLVGVGLPLVELRPVPVRALAFGTHARLVFRVAGQPLVTTPAPAPDQRDHPDWLFVPSLLHEESPSSSYRKYIPSRLAVNYRGYILLVTTSRSPS